MNIELEALKLIQAWSVGLITVGSGLIAVIGALYKDVQRKSAAQYFSIASCTFIFISIICGSNLVGSLPIIALNLNEIEGIALYNAPGNLSITIKTSASGQVVFFVLGVFSFILFAIGRSPRP